MFKKFAIAFLLGMLFVSTASTANAAVAIAVPPTAGGGGGAGGAALLPFLGAVVGAEAVMLLDIYGVPFPGCTYDWLQHPEATGFLGEKCYGEYPEPVHKWGV